MSGALVVTGCPKLVFEAPAEPAAEDPRSEADAGAAQDADAGGAAPEAPSPDDAGIEWLDAGGGQGPPDLEPCAAKDWPPAEGDLEWGQAAEGSEDYAASEADLTPDGRSKSFWGRRWARRRAIWRRVWGRQAAEDEAAEHEPDAQPQPETRDAGAPAGEAAPQPCPPPMQHAASPPGEGAYPRPSEED